MMNLQCVIEVHIINLNMEVILFRVYQFKMKNEYVVIVSSAILTCSLQLE